MFVPPERSCHTEYTCEIWKLFNTNLLKSNRYELCVFYFSTRRLKVMVKVTRSKHLVPVKKYFNKKYACEIGKPYLLQLKSFEHGLSFQNVGQKSRGPKQIQHKILVPTKWERPCHKEYTSEIWNPYLFKLKNNEHGFFFKM